MLLFAATQKALQESRSLQEVESVFEDELPRFADELVGDDPMRQGGGPDDQSAELLDIRAIIGGIEASVLVSFIYRIPTSCGDSPFSDRGSGVRLVRIQSGEVEVEDSRTGWDRADHNSAADGL
jgi:hypothetical protein